MHITAGPPTLTLTLTLTLTILAAVVLVGCGTANPSIPTDGGRTAGPPTAAPTAAPTQPDPTMPGASTPGPWPTPAVTAAVTPASLPVKAGSVALAPGPDGGLYVLVTETRSVQSDPPGTSVLALLDAAGRTRTGWPIQVDGWLCGAEPIEGATPPSTRQPLVATDGSVRLVCDAEPVGDLAGKRLAFAFTAEGTPMPGWPADPRTGDSWEQAATVVGDTLYVPGRHITGEEGTETASVASWVNEIGADGSGREGTHASAPMGVMPEVEPGTDGSLRLVDTGGRPGFADPGDQKLIMAIDVSGPIPGWPLMFDLSVSQPAFGPDGRMYLAQVRSGRTSTLVVARDGEFLPIGSDPLDIVQTKQWSGAGPDGWLPAPPIVSPDGTVFLIEEAGSRLTVVALDPAGKVMAGWPYQAAVHLEWRGRCSAGDTGCGVFRTTPIIGPGNVLHLLLAADEASKGGSILAIGPDGAVRPGWPVVLPDAGSTFRSVVVGPDGTAYAVTLDRVTEPTTATILAIDPSGAIRYRVPIVAP
jgi:hypothetical protein